MASAACRFCATPLEHLVVDLGVSPLANRYLAPDELGAMEPFYPLRVWVCHACFLVQLEEFEAPERIFADYAYFSSYSATWLAHAEAFATDAIERFRLSAASQVVEIASNDGYLLQYFRARGVPVLGVEPAGTVAAAARARGIATVERFFDAALGRELAADAVRADLLVANNVLAHVPRLNDFVEGLARVLAPGGVLTIEVPHLAHLLAERQFDTIYHEHFSYFSLATARAVLAAHGLTVFDVEELPTHGGSLRLYAGHAASAPASSPRVDSVLAGEAHAGLGRLEIYTAFGAGVREVKRDLLEHLIDARRRGRSVVGYGAPAKGNTLLNYCGIRDDLLDYTVDVSPHKQGRFLPGSRLPIYPPARILETRPDDVLILPWNLKDEVMTQMSAVRDWGGQFLVAIPELKRLP